MWAYKLYVSCLHLAQEAASPIITRKQSLFFPALGGKFRLVEGKYGIIEHWESKHVQGIFCDHLLWHFKSCISMEAFGCIKRW
jgi:hypothetical protein